MNKQYTGFKCGVEHEFALVESDGTLRDFSNTTYDDVSKLIQQMPTFAEDEGVLYTDIIGVRQKRWYIEGFERFNVDHSYRETIMKGVEVRTPVCDNIADVIDVLEQNTANFALVARASNLYLAVIGYNPFLIDFTPTPPLNAYEIQKRLAYPEGQTAYMHMLTYGADVSISFSTMKSQDVIYAAEKLTYYSPYMVPFSFFSPFYDGKLWDGFSRRTFYRTGRRPAALAHVATQKHIVESTPSITKIASNATEVGRIEFKAFDSVADLKLYGSLLALVKGVVLDDTLTGCALTPDASLHQKSAIMAFNDPHILEQSTLVLQAAWQALNEEDRLWLKPLQDMIQHKVTPANGLIEAYNESRSIKNVLRSTYV